jgi:prophage antirepressor-like protein
MDDAILIPAFFIRHRRQLRAFLLDDQAWFVARDLGRLMNHPIETRVQHNLDDDQRQQAWVRGANGDYEKVLLLSESGVYATLIHYYHPENRCIRQWITQQVVPCLRDQHREHLPQPRQRVLSWGDRQLGVLQWHGRLWLPYEDLPRVARLEPPGPAH